MSAPPFKLPTLLVVALLAAGPLFGKLGSGSLENSDDAMFAEAARHALRSGDLLRYSWDGARLDYRYGPLHMLALRTSLSLFGDGELGVRLPAAMAALLCLLAVALLGRELCIAAAERELADAVALLAALSLLASGHFYRAARAGGADALLAAFSALAMLAYVRSWRSPRAIYLAALALAGAALTKSALGLLPLLPIGVDWLLAPRGERPPLRQALPAFALFVAVAASWHVYQAVTYGHEFIDTYFIYNLFGRAAGIAGLGPPVPFSSQVWAHEHVLLLLAGAALIFGAVKLRQRRGARLCLIWSVAGLLPVLISRTRLSQYLLPALPALAALAGLLLARGLTFAAAQRGAEVEADKQLQATPAQATPAPARLLLALLAALLLGLFANNNLSRWLAPDFTPQLREVLAALPPRARLPRLLVFNDYHAAARWYADRPTRLVTDSKRAQSLLTGSRAMKETHVVEYVPPGQLVRRFAREQPLAVLTTVLFARRVAALVDALPAARRQHIARVARGAYVLYLERSSARAR